MFSEFHSPVYNRWIAVSKSEKFQNNTEIKILLKIVCISIEWEYGPIPWEQVHLFLQIIKILDFFFTHWELPLKDIQIFRGSYVLISEAFMYIHNHSAGIVAKYVCQIY